MKILILNGSPKGEQSVTMQYMRLLEKNYPDVEWKVIHAAAQIRRLESNAAQFNGLMEEIKASDGVLWAFPLYFMLVHSNYKRFIELIFERKAEGYFQGKYTAVFSTSIHYYDNTAHEYMHAVCDDLGMQYTGCFSAEMHDMFKKKERKNLLIFGGSLLNAITGKQAFPKAFPALHYSDFQYHPSSKATQADQKDKKIIIITDAPDGESSLGNMIERFQNNFSQPVEVTNLHKINIKGGCLGCVQCGFDNQCVYGDSDDIKTVYTEKVKKADILVFALQIKDRYFSARWKAFLDRRFMFTHQPFLLKRQVVYLISGNLGQTPNIREIIIGGVEMDGDNLTEIITDEAADNTLLDRLIDSAAQRALEYSEKQYIKPQSFLGVSAIKLFRDELYGGLRFVFQGDYRYFKKHQLFDFPQKALRTRLTSFFMILLTKIPFMKENIRKNMKYHMVQPFQGMLAKGK